MTTQGSRAYRRPTFRVENLNQVLYAIRRTDSRIKKEVERASGRIASRFVQDATRTASGSPQAAAAATSLRVRKGIVPKVAVGGSGVFPSSTPRGRVARYADVWWGSEFGSYNHPQFPPAVPKGGRWFYRTLNVEGRDYVELWIGAVDKAIAREWK